MIGIDLYINSSEVIIEFLLLLIICFVQEM